MGGRWCPWGTIRIKICNHPTRDQPLTRGADFPGNPNSSLAIGQPGNHYPSLLSFYFLGWLLWRAAGSKWRRLRSIFSIFCRIGLSVYCIGHFISSTALLKISIMLNKSHESSIHCIVVGGFAVGLEGLLLHRQLRPHPLPRHPLPPLRWGCPPLCGENNIPCIPTFG